MIFMSQTAIFFKKFQEAQKISGPQGDSTEETLQSKTSQICKNTRLIIRPAFWKTRIFWIIHQIIEKLVQKIIQITHIKEL